MVMTKQQMMQIVGELQDRLKRLGCPALINELTKLEKSPYAVRELLDLARKPEEASDQQT